MARNARFWVAGLLAAGLAAPAAGQGVKTSEITGADIARLRPGRFIWTPELAPIGPMVMVVSLEAQQAYVYRNGVRIGVSTVSTGKKGKETPSGVFTILQKTKDHRSTLYDHASMPYMQRLTWDGIALHGGNVPGKPASHGCIRLPMAFAKVLFGETSTGMTVVIADDAPGPSSLNGGDLPAQTAAASVAAAPGEVLDPDESFRQPPQAAPDGPEAPASR
ncbi:MAG: L,D-transpeptidase family protein [Phenylobacterium sp.]